MLYEVITDVFLEPVGLDVEGESALLAAAFGPLDDVAAVGELAGDAEHARLLVEDRVDLLGGEPFLLLDEHRDGRVDVAAARPHDRPFEGGEAHRGVDRDSPLDGAVGDAVADVRNNFV